VTPQEKLHSGISDLGLSITDDQESSLFQYLQLLDKWNRKFNLTAVRDIREMVSLHLLDSLSIAPFIDAQNLLDVGTGPGLPGIPLAICFPEMQVSLLDSNGKKIRFCRQAIMELGLKNACAFQERIETFESQGQFQQITTRAFTSLDNMVKLLAPLISVDTELLAMKGTLPHEEISVLEKSDYRIKTELLDVPFVHAERHLIKVVKI
jgi:16S rRNA (guanine527-N7)-methyltransferase